MPAPSTRLASRLWPYALLLGLVLAFMGDALFAQRIFFLRDTFTGLPSFVQRSAAALKTDEWLPWWNPFSGFGKPYIADPEMGFFYPPNWVHYWLSPGRAVATFFSPSFDYRRSAVIEPLPRDPRVAPPPAPSGGGTVRSVAYKWNSVTLRTTAPNRALLVVSDAWFPGWIARVDGVEKPIYRTDLDFRGVVLDPGAHEVVFSYRPLCIPIGIGVSAFFAAGMIVTGWLWWRSRRLPG